TADFKKPNSVVEVAVEKGTNPPELASEYTPSGNVVKELFVKGTEPSSVSTKFDKLDPVRSLTAEYDEKANRIDISWDYDEVETIAFDVNFSTDSGSMKSLTTTKEYVASIDNVEHDVKYTIEV